MRPLKTGSEAAFQLQVENLATFHGWATFHAPDNRPITAKSGRTYVQNVKAGFPDLVLSRGTELLVAELKTENGRLSKDQDAWLDRFRTFAASIDEVVAQLRATPGVRAVDGIELPIFEVHIWRPSMLQMIADRLSRPTLEPIGELGVCPHCESADVIATLVRDVFSCGRCGSTWSGIRRRVA